MADEKMPVDFSRLSVEEIRKRYLDPETAVSPHLLLRLRKDPRAGVRQVFEILARRKEGQKREKERLDQLVAFERLLWNAGARHVAGVDEVGIGPMAGPVVAAAVVFPPESCVIAGIDDSKRVDQAERRRLAALIRGKAAAVSIGAADVEEIDRLNIYHAGLQAMRRAVDGLPFRPDHVVSDARVIPGLEMPQNPFNKGDGLNYSIAAASIVAKVYRDDWMERLAREYPAYGFERHKGYCTPEHQQAIRRNGTCPVHRKSFLFVEELCGGLSPIFYSMRQRVGQADSREALHRLEKEFDQLRPCLGEQEGRKLKQLFSRRWKTM
jgi:ribonuclease HII